MGFTKELITMAWEESNTEADVINTLLILSDKNNALSNAPTVNLYMNASIRNKMKRYN